jgi:hypothetical protein
MILSNILVSLFHIYYIKTQLGLVFLNFFPV